MKRDRRAKLLLAAAIIVPWCSSLVRADGLTLVGSTFPLRNCRIQSILGGQIVYTDPSGQRQQRSLEEVATLTFDDFEVLDEAEKLIAERDLAAGARRLMQAVLKARNDLQRQWVHCRLSQIHDARGEYVQAAGHAAVVMSMSDDAYWARLEPVSQPNEPSYPAARESLNELQAATRSAKNATLKSSLGRMTKIVQPITQRLAGSYDGPAIEPGSTVSGISRTALLGGASASEVPPPAPPASSPDPANRKPLQPPTAPAPQPPAPSESTSPAALEALLREEKFTLAVEACNRIAADPGDRDLAQFLFQYGTALSGAGKPADAAVMFVRCGTHFALSIQAAPSLVQAARIHQDSLGNPAAAVRLLQRAIAQAESLGQSEAAEQARRELASLSTPSAP